MSFKKKDFSTRDFDYEEDDYDRYQTSNKEKKKEVFTNKSSMKKFEFDYEEDAYEPGRRR